MEKQLINLDGRIVIVTGAAGGGIGTHTTRMLAEAGATVVAVSRSPREHRQERRAATRSKDCRSCPWLPTFRPTKAWRRPWSAARRAKGALYGLVNVAGGAAVRLGCAATRVTRADWRARFNQNLETMFFMSQAVAAELRDKHLPGSIVSVSSISGMNTAPFHVAYGTAKAAIVAATRTLGRRARARQHSHQRHSPGHHDHPRIGGNIDDYTERDRNAIAMGRRAHANEQAGAILFFHFGPVVLHHRPDRSRGRRPQPQVDASRRAQHVLVPQGRVVPCCDQALRKVGDMHEQDRRALKTATVRSRPRNLPGRRKLTVSNRTFHRSTPEPSATNCGAKSGCRWGVSRRSPRSAITSPIRSSMTRFSSCVRRPITSRLFTTFAPIGGVVWSTRPRALTTPRESN